MTFSQLPIGTIFRFMGTRTPCTKTGKTTYRMPTDMADFPADACEWVTTRLRVELPRANKRELARIA